MDESTLLTRVCRFYAFQDDHAVTGGEELQWKWVRDKTDPHTNRASSASYFLISWQKPFRHYCGILPRIFQNYTWCQLSEEQKFSREKFLRFHKNLQKPRKFSHRETFIVYGICAITTMSWCVILEEYLTNNRLWWYLKTYINYIQVIIHMLLVCIQHI